MIDHDAPRLRRRSFSTELLTEIHIKLDKQGLEGLDEKELIVLLTEEVSDSTEQLDNISRTTNEISTKIDHTAGQITVKIDESVTPIQAEIIKLRRTISLWAKLLVSAIWAVSASLIASLIFKACGG